MTIATIDYPTLLATVNPDDLAMLMTFVVGVDVQAASQAEFDGLSTQAQRLYDAGLLTKLSRCSNNVANGLTLPWSLEAIVAPMVVGYAAKLAGERIRLSREVLP